MKCVLIGFGAMGKNHARALNSHPSFHLCAVIETRSLTTSELTNLEPGTAIFSKIEDLDNFDFDCVVVASPTATHYEICERLIVYNKPILLEKPCTHNYATGLKLKKLVEKSNAKIAIGHIERMNPVVQRLKNLIKSGLIGEVIHINVTRVGGSPKHAENGNNVVLDLAVHDFDVLQYIFGNVQYLYATCHYTLTSSTCDTAEIVVSFSRNMTASIHVNWITPIKVRSLRVTGTKGVCFVDYILQTCSMQTGNLLELPSVNFKSFPDVIEHYKSSDKIEFNINKAEPLMVQYDHFCKFIHGEYNELCTLDEGLNCVRLAEDTLSNAKIFRQSDKVSIR